MIRLVNLITVLGVCVWGGVGAFTSGEESEKREPNNVHLGVKSCHRKILEF